MTLWTCNGQANQEWTRPDPALAHLSIGHDLGYIVPDLKEALALNPGLKLMANPKTLAAKHGSSVANMASRHKAKAATSDATRTCLEARKRRGASRT